MIMKVTAMFAANDPKRAHFGGDKRTPLFEVAAEFIRQNIALGHLSPGQVLQESALSERLNMSRATLKRALEIVEADGLIERFSGRGFVVSGKTTDPKRNDLRQIELDFSSIDDHAGQPSWLGVYEDAAFQVARSPIFGRYRISEAQMAEDYGVSRTIVRDVLGRLQERRLVQKSKTSRWIVEPLTSKRIRDKFELRNILEVAALKTAKTSPHELQTLVTDIKALVQKDEISHSRWFEIDQRFFQTTVLTTSNEDLLSYASSNRLALEACQTALFSLGLPSDKYSLQELQQVLELLLSGSIPAAASMLSSHLAKAADRMISQLKITAIIAPPEDFPKYLRSD